MVAQHPSLPEELRGAVDLTDPIQVLLTQFGALMAKEKGIAAVMEAPMSNNRSVFFQLISFPLARNDPDTLGVMKKAWEFGPFDGGAVGGIGLGNVEFKAA